MFRLYSILFLFPTVFTSSEAICYQTCAPISQCIDGTEMTATITEQLRNIIRSENEIAQNFHVSSKHDGRRYYVRKAVTAAMDIPAAEATCQSLGGKLAEVSDEAELEFLRTFIRSLQLTCVFIAGSDEKQEGQWINQFKNTPLPYTRWGPGDPNRGRAENCVCLWKDFDYLMADIECVSTPHVCTFICEI